MATDIIFRPAQLDDLEPLAALYTHHWCNGVPDLNDKLLAARHCVIIQLVRSPLSIVAEKDGEVVGVCLGCVTSDGHALGIFPQGTRSRDNTPTPMHTGVALIALRAGKPVIPVYIGGPYRLFRRIPVRVGKPVDLSDLGRRFDGETLNAATRRIEQAVWSMKDA